MVFKFCVLVLWRKVALALEGLRRGSNAACREVQGSIFKKIARCSLGA